MNIKFDENFKLVITKMRNFVNNSEKIIKKQQIQQADNFLNAGMYELAFNISQNGYDFTINQQAKIDNHIFSIVKQNLKYGLIY